MPRLAPRAAAVAAATLGLLLLAGPALAAEGTTPIAGEHDGVIGAITGIGWAAVVGILLGAVCFALLPSSGTADDDPHH